ncbi:MAG: type V CRISPR-associated protein Cas12b, partial [Methylacidiphilaceae bacterium]|nr:type V CRISPR-associated protein Cas12b [Candidatus Methylacidiphilaceae bacterium]
MNRIYQGKVTRVEWVGEDNKLQPFSDDLKAATKQWRKALWEHHELFQDAVNYYTLALAALAEGADEAKKEGKAVRQWRKQVKENWVKSQRKAESFEGPHRRLAELLGVKADLDGDAAFEQSASTILKPARSSSKEERSAALLQLLYELKDGSALNKVCVGRLALLCNETYNGTSNEDVGRQHKKRKEMLQQIHKSCKTDEGRRDTIKRAPELVDPNLFLTKSSSRSVRGKQAREQIKKNWENAQKTCPSLTEIEKEFFAEAERRADIVEIALPGRRPNRCYHIAAVFQFYPCERTLDAFLEATSTMPNDVVSKGRDLIADLRRACGGRSLDYVTNLAFLCKKNKQQSRADWFELDLAAFIEAINAPHRYVQDTVKRQEEAEKFSEAIRAMKGRGRAASDDDDALPGFEIDERIKLLRRLVTDHEEGLAYLGEDEEGRSGEYTIQERTLRHWSAIRAKWRKLAENGEASPEKLWAVVAAEQADHVDDFGSAPLYRKLTEDRYHSIWRDPGTEDWHADDPLRAWLQYTDLKRDLDDKNRLIRFTPAHAIQSPRYFHFPKGGRLKAEHKPGTKAFQAGIAVRTDKKWRGQKVLITYSAPRMGRDRLRQDSETSLDHVPWLQPMMQALGLEEPDTVDFGNCRITLQPSDREDIQLTFPINVSPKKLTKHIGKDLLWRKQFKQHPEGKQFYNASLRWPHEKPSPENPWYSKLNDFSILSVDLGQRHAGAFSMLGVCATPSSGQEPKEPSRFIGEAGGKKWWARPEASRLLRLPGEDRKEWRAKTSLDTDDGGSFDFREELHGSRGRMPRAFETEECHNLLIASLGETHARSFLTAGWDDPKSPWRLSFPEQNDRLLAAARRALYRMAQLHRWCWFLRGTDQRRSVAREQIRQALGESDDESKSWLPAELKNPATLDDSALVADCLARLLTNYLNSFPDLLVWLANRVLPLRGRSWKWEVHPKAGLGNRIHVLTQNGPALDRLERPIWLRGQRGLSMERIHQIEELRKRFQSLNQTLRRDIGAKPPIRRDEKVPDPCPDLLEKLDQIKEQRVNQTAHMILAEALGVRLTAPPSNKADLRAKWDQHGIY